MHYDMECSACEGWKLWTMYISCQLMFLWYVHMFVQTWISYINMIIHKVSTFTVYKSILPEGESRILLAASVNNCFMYSLVAPSKMVWSFTSNMLQWPVQYSNTGIYKLHKFFTVVNLKCYNAIYIFLSIFPIHPWFICCNN